MTHTRRNPHYHRSESQDHQKEHEVVVYPGGAGAEASFQHFSKGTDSRIEPVCFRCICINCRRLSPRSPSNVTTFYCKLNRPEGHYRPCSVSRRTDSLFGVITLAPPYMISQRLSASNPSRSIMCHETGGHLIRPNQPFRRHRPCPA